MKTRIKSLLVVAVLSAALSACGSGSSGGTQEEQLASVESLPVPQENGQTERAAQPADTTVPAETITPQEPAAQEPVIPPLPVANQTGWTLGDGIETRQPLELVKSVMCVARAVGEAASAPASSADCSAQFQDLVSNGSMRFAGLPVDDGTVVVEREGCAYLPNEMALVCSWQFSVPDSSMPSGFANYWQSAPFMPSFSTQIESCEVGKDHLFPMGVGRDGSAARGPTVKAPEPVLPQGCVGWTELTSYIEQHPYYSLNTDVPQD